MASKNYNSGKYSGEWGWIRYVKKHCRAVLAWRFHGSKGPEFNGYSSPVDVAWIDRQGNFYLDQVKYSNKKSKTKIPYISKEFDEKSLISNELVSLAKADFGVELQVFSESDSEIYDPKGKARHARPFKPAILIE